MNEIGLITCVSISLFDLLWLCGVYCNFSELSSIFPKIKWSALNTTTYMSAQRRGLSVLNPVSFPHSNYTTTQQRRTTTVTANAPTHHNVLILQTAFHVTTTVTANTPTGNPPSSFQNVNPSDWIPSTFHSVHPESDNGFRKLPPCIIQSA